VGRDDRKIVTIDLSDTKENLLTQEIKWGDHSTIITVHDYNSTNIDDSYIRDGNYDDENYGSESYFYIRNYSSSNMHSLIRFDLSQIPRNAIIGQANLFLYLESNDLDSGESYNISIHQIFSHYNWSEEVVTWETKPNSSDFNDTFTDEEYIFGGSGEPDNQYISWLITPIIQAKRMNESFYLFAHYNNGGDSTDDVRFISKESPNENKPFIYVIYYLKGLVSMNSSETPFYTNVSNPYYVNLEKDECQDIIWWVNATGEKSDYIFFTYANKTFNGSINTISDLVDITIV